MQTELLEKILDELQALRAEVAELRAGTANAHPFELLSPDSIVEKDYVAWRFGCSERAVRAGEKGTDKIKRVSNKPLKFIKSDVDAVFRKINKSTKDQAEYFRQTARPVRRKLIINRLKSK